MMPPELLERHEGDPFTIDTFDGAFSSFNLNQYARWRAPTPTAVF